MARQRPMPLSEGLVTVGKGEAAPVTQTGRRETAAPEPRVAITFRLTEAAHEWLRAESYRTRRTKQAIVDEMFAGYMAHKNHG